MPQNAYVLSEESKKEVEQAIRKLRSGIRAGPGIKIVNNPDSMTISARSLDDGRIDDPHNPGDPFFAVLVKANGVDGSSNPLYDLYLLRDTAYAIKLNSSGALAPKCSRARWNASLTITAATDGSVASAYRDATGAIQLFDLQELDCHT